MGLEEDVQPIMSLATDGAAEAAQNVKMADVFDINPEAVRSSPETYKKEYDQQLYTPIVPKPVSDRMYASTQHAAVIKEDMNIWDDFGKQLEFMSDTITEKKDNRKASNLGYRKAIGETLSEDEEFQLSISNSKEDNLQEKYGYTFGETVPGEVAGIVYDFGAGVWQNKDLVFEGAGIGAVLGTVVPGPGTLAGAGTGALAGLTVAQMKDTFEQSTGQVYNSLSNIEATDPLTGETTIHSKNERRAIALGAGALMAAVETAAIPFVAGKVPWVKKFVNSKTFSKFMIEPSGKKYLDVARALGHSMMAEGASEATQEYIQIAAEEIGKTWDGTETKFFEGVSNAVKNLPDHSERLAKAGVLGAFGGAAFTGGGIAVGEVGAAISDKLPKKPGENTVLQDGAPVPYQPVSDLTGPIKDMPTVVRGTKAIQLKMLIDVAAQRGRETKTNQLLPKEMDAITQGFFDQNGISDVWIDPEELGQWANTEEKAAEVRKILDPTNLAAGAMGSPIRLSAYKMTRLAQQFGDVSALAKLAPEMPSAKTWLQHLDGARQQREDLMANAPKGETVIEPDLRVTDQDITNERAYLEQPTFTKEMYDVIPEEQAVKYNEDQLKARIEVANAIKEDAQFEMEQVTHLETQRQILNEESRVLDQAENHSDIQIVEEFMNNSRVFGDLNEFQQAQQAAGKPIYAINPATVPQEIMNQLNNDPELKKTLKSRGIFNKDGARANEVAGIFRVKMSKLLNTLARSPTQEEAVALRTQRIEAEAKIDAESNAQIDQSKLANAYNDMTNNHIEEMRILRDKYWSSVKKGIKRVALPLPTVDALKSRARNIVGGMKVKDLNPNQWKVAERRSQRKAVDAILKNETETAFREKTNAALNSQTTKEAHLMTAKVNRALKWVARLDSDRVQTQLENANPIYKKAINTIRQLYNFDPKSESFDPQVYTDFVKAMDEQGSGVDFEITPEVQEWLSPAQNVNELTVDQLLWLTDHMKSIMNQVRMEDAFYSAYQKEGEQVVLQTMRDELHADIITHEGYNPDKIIDRGEFSGWNKISNFIAGADAFKRNLKDWTNRLGQYKFNNIWEKVTWQVIEGVQGGPYGIKARSILQKEMKDFIRKGIDTYGKKEFRQLGVSKVFVKQFEKLAHLNYGRLTKLDLMQILMNMGTDSNKARVENFQVGREEMMQILEKHLTQKDFDYVQNTVWKSFEMLKPRLAEIHKITHGVELEFLEPEKFTAHGKEYAGGYFPVKLKKDLDPIALKERLEEMQALADDGSRRFVTPHPAHEGMVRSPHTKNRTDTDYTISLDVNNYDMGLTEVVHDITMRVPVRDVMKLMTDKDIKADIQSVIGHVGYNAMANAVMSHTNSTQVQDALQYSQLGKMASILYSSIESPVAVALIAGKASTFIVNMNTIPKIVHVMGLKSGTKHLLQAGTRIGIAMKSGGMHEVVKWAGEIDPSIYDSVNELNDFSNTTIADILPKKGVFKNEPYRLMKSGQDKMNNFLMNGILGTQDLVFKVLTVTAAYNQYLSGEAEGHSMNEISRMTDDQKRQNAEAYALSVSASLTMRAKPSDKAPIQILPHTKLFSRFFNEVRSNINTIQGETEKSYWAGKRMVRAAQKGDFTAAGRNFYDGTSRLASMTLMMGMVPYILAGIAKKFNPFAKDDDKDKSIGDIANELTTVDGFGDAAMGMFVTNTPMMREMAWAVKTDKTASVPLMFGLTNVAQGSYLGLMYIGDELNLIEANKEMKTADFKKMAHAVSIFTGGLPVEGAFQLYQAMTGGEDLGSLIGGAEDQLEPAVDAIDKFIDNNDEDEETAFRRAVDEEDQDSLQQAVNDAKELKKKLNRPEEAE